MEHYYNEKQKEFHHLSSELKINLPCLGQVEPLTKKLKMEETFFNRVRDNADILKYDVRLSKTKLGPQELPKSVLVDHTRKMKFKLPVYHTEQVEKLFYSTVSVDGKLYANSYL